MAVSLLDERAGFGLVTRFLHPAAADHLARTLEAAPELDRIRTRGGLTYGARNLLDVPDVADLVDSPAFRALVEPVLGPGARAVRGLLFDKQDRANWRVPWHQDLVIAVREERDAPGFSGWSTKGGVVHVQPSVDVLERMVAVRLHLDAVGEENGPLRVLPGSHLHGRLARAEVQAWAARTPPRTCTAERGGALLLRPLLLHASSSATRAGRRRVLHIECAAGPLPHGLEWR